MTKDHDPLQPNPSSRVGSLNAEKRLEVQLKKIHEYEEHAAECRDMAKTAHPTHREQLEHMARTWDQLAEARRQQLQKRGLPEEAEQSQEAIQ